MGSYPGGLAVQLFEGVQPVALDQELDKGAPFQVRYLVLEIVERPGAQLGQRDVLVRGSYDGRPGIEWLAAVMTIAGPDG